MSPDVSSDDETFYEYRGNNEKVTIQICAWPSCRNGCSCQYQLCNQHESEIQESRATARVKRKYLHLYFDDVEDVAILAE